jgi:hypothetical protein
MRYGVFPYQNRPCPLCKSSVPSTVVYSLDGAARGVNYTVHECAICGTHVHRIVGYNIGSPNIASELIVEPVACQAEIEAVCQAAESAG